MRLLGLLWGAMSLAFLVACSGGGTAGGADGAPADGGLDGVGADVAPPSDAAVDADVGPAAPDALLVDVIPPADVPGVDLSGPDVLAVDVPPPDGEDTGEDGGDAGADVAGPLWVELPEEVVAEPAAACANCFVLANDAWDGVEDVRLPSSGDYTFVDGELTYYFRAWVRFRMPHPGVVKRLFVYTGGEGGDVQVALSTGFPGGHYPCLDETNGADLYPVGAPHRMTVTAEGGWRVFDVSSLGHAVGGYDEFFVFFDQSDGARVGLAPPTATAPGDYTTYGGLIADGPGDGMRCFPSMSTFVDDADAPLAWLVRAEIEAETVAERHVFSEPEGAPAVGGHVAFGDYDRDGDEDFLSGGRLWQNDGAGGFTDVTAAAGLAGLGGETIWGDYDNDGAPDILAVGSAARLFRNAGDGTFVEVTEAAGLAIDASSQGVAFLDFDRDGWLDFYAASYGTLADGEIPTRDYLFRNGGDGTFADVTEAMGIPVTGNVEHGRGVCVADYDSDGWPDVYVGNYRLDPNQLWRNLGGEGGGGFLDRSRPAGVRGVQESGAYGHTIGPSWGDLDGDGLFDLVVPNLAHPRFFYFSDPTTLYFNEGDGTFAAVEAPQSGILYDETHSDSVLFDYDNDGDLDLYLTAVYEGRRSYLYANDGAGHYDDATYEAGIRHYNGWGAAAGDVDGDGDLDLVAHRLFRNDQDTGRHFLQVVLTGGARPGDPLGMSNRDAIGAVVAVRLPGGDRPIVRLVEGGTGTGCQNSRVLHFGLGDATVVSRLTVTWPSGRTQELTDVAADQRLTIDEPPAP